jgi:AcrR family transcriptional regulator
LNAKINTNRRLSPEDREQQILEGAVKFFAEKGFSGQTRELALQLGITQPLLYRYFPTKRSLIERVFEEVYINKLDSAWSIALTDRSKSLHKRLCTFYCNYSEATYRNEWIRIYMFSALMEEPLNKHYIKLVEEQILTPICIELRDYCGLPKVDISPISQIELDHIWVMHGGLFYHAIRKHIYRSRVSDDFEEIVSRAVSTMLEGSKAAQ